MPRANSRTFKFPMVFLGEVHFQSKVDRGLAEGVGAARLTLWKLGKLRGSKCADCEGRGGDLTYRQKTSHVSILYQAAWQHAIVIQPSVCFIVPLQFMFLVVICESSAGEELQQLQEVSGRFSAPVGLGRGFVAQTH